MAVIDSIPSANLKTRFARAEKAVIDGNLVKVIVLGVRLVEFEMVEKCEIEGKDVGYLSFMQTFVLGIVRRG